MININNLDPTHNLFIVKCTNGDKSLIKFGYTTNIKSRMRDYLNHNPFTEILYTCKRTAGKKIESDFHKEFSSSYNKEWYNIYMKDVILNRIDLNGEVVDTGVVHNIKQKLLLIKSWFKSIF